MLILDNNKAIIPLPIAIVAQERKQTNKFTLYAIASYTPMTMNFCTPRVSVIITNH